MMRKLFLVSCLPLVLGLFTFITSAFKQQETHPAVNTLETLNAMVKAIVNIKTLRYDLQRNERVKGKMNFTESKVKLQVSPRKLYIAVGVQEVLWIEGTNGGNALINPGSFPYVNVNLDPMGSLMRKNQHHTINELGMDYLGSILKAAMQHYGDKIEKYIVFLGEEKCLGRTCYKLAASFPDFSWESYTFKKGETILSVAKKRNISEYMILENNPQYSWFDGGAEGQVLKIPTAYSKSILLMIDKEYMLPISEKIFDDKGLFESYEYSNLKVNVPIAAEEFTKEYKDYHF
jgi:hypothetical protein